MAETFFQLTPQPDFPVEDLTEGNAEFMELITANMALVKQNHDTAEQQFVSSRIGHPALLRCVLPVHETIDQYHAIDQGIIMFESMYAIVVNERMSDDFFRATGHAAGLLQTTQAGFREYCLDAFDRMKLEMPRTSEIIRTNSVRNQTFLAEYALLGAALSRQFELDMLISDVA